MIQTTPVTEVPIRARCRLLDVAPSGYYAWQEHPVSRRAARDQVLLPVLERIHRESDARYGTPRVLRELRALGERCGGKRVARLRRGAGLRAVYPPPFRVTTDGQASDPTSNVLAQRFAIADHPELDRVWTADFTYLWTGEGWLFLAVVLDLASRRVIGWALHRRMTTTLTLAAFTMAVAQRALRPGASRLHHSDRGRQYVAAEYRTALRGAGFTPSLSGRGNCYDNAVTESFFATFRKELTFRRDFHTRAEAERAVIAFIEGWYNTRRRHSALDYRSPVDFEAALLTKHIP
jgi:putative transposase